MTEAGIAPRQGATVCPFVALDEDRDRRSIEPDRHHRCFAEPTPAPRAIAHQMAYCLAPNFPNCPTFQDWAIRAAAEAVPPPPGHSGALIETTPGTAALLEQRAASSPPPAGRRMAAGGAPDWAQPPPWLSPGGASGDEIPPFLAGGAAGTAGDIAGVGAGTGGPIADGARVSGGAGGAGGVEGGDAAAKTIPQRPLPAASAAQARSGDRGRGRRGKTDDAELPEWRRGGRPAAYPTIKTRGDGGGGGIPRLALAAVGLALLAAVVFFLPGFLAGGDSTERPRGTGPGESPSTAVETATPRPTPTPAPTPQVHIVASGDTLGGIARQNGLTIEELLAANPQITDPDRISIGDEIIIPDDPVTPSDDVPDEDATDQVGRTERPSGGDPPQETAEP